MPEEDFYMSPEDLEEQIKTDMEKGGIRWEQREWASFHRPGQALSPMVMIITKVREIEQLNGGNPFTSHREKQNLTPLERNHEIC